MPFSGFELPGELALLQQVVRRFVQEEIVPVERSLDPDAPCIPDERLAPLQEKARQAGLWYLPVPKEFGGGGLSTFALAVVMEEASKHTYSLPEAGGGAFGHDLPVPLFKGNDEQKQRYVSPSVRHGWRWFTAITEPSGGSDPARAIQTRAERRNGRWVLNGRKMFATGADRARFGVVYARTDPERGRGGISAFIVPTGIPGMEVRPVKVIRDHWTTEIVFENAEIPAENLLGEEGRGFDLAQDWLVRNRVIMSAQCVGIADRAVEMAIAYAPQRWTFGAPLSTRQAVQFMIADSAVEIRAARWLTWEAAWKDDRGENARYEASVAKLFATEMAFRVVDRVIQIHGGMGLSKEMPLEHWFRGLRVWRIGEGPSEIHRYLIARELLGAAARGG